MDKQQREAQQAFNDAIEAIKYDYMYMGTETNSEHGYPVYETVGTKKHNLSFNDDSYLSISIYK